MIRYGVMIYLDTSETKEKVLHLLVTHVAVI